METRVNLIDGVRTDQTDLDKIIAREKKRRQKKILRRTGKILTFIFIAWLIFASNTISSRNAMLSNLGRLSFWEGVARIVTEKDKILQGETENQINILILGMGGALHEGPYLTDTIILAGLKPDQKKLALLSIPRDLYVPIPEYGWNKINAANSLGITDAGDGGKLASKVISSILNIPIHYWVKIDFNLFRKLIDEIGGIDLEVERGFVDYQFPGPGFTYRVVSFNKGLQWMDGQRALEFARSRHGTAGEGSDFARCRRQQKILLAVKEKIEGQNLLASPKKLWRIYNLISENLSSNLDFSEALRLAKLLPHVEESEINLAVFDTSPQGLLEAEIGFDGAYLLRPKSGNFTEMAEVAHNFFAGKSELSGFGYLKRASGGLPAQADQSLEESRAPRAKLLILNGTWIKNLAKNWSEILEKDDFEVIQIGNGPERNLPKTIIYTRDPNAYKKELSSLKEKLEAEISQDLPEELKNIFETSGADFLIVLGENSI